MPTCLKQRICEHYVLYIYGRYIQEKLYHTYLSRLVYDFKIKYLSFKNDSEVYM